MSLGGCLRFSEVSWVLFVGARRSQGDVLVRLEEFPVFLCGLSTFESLVRARETSRVLVSSA